MTGKEYGFIIQALAEEAMRYRSIGDSIVHRKLTATLQTAININQLNQLFDCFDEEQLHLISEALEETADRKQIEGTTAVAVRMRETAEIVRSTKKLRELDWIDKHFKEGIA